VATAVNRLGNVACIKGATGSEMMNTARAEKPLHLTDDGIPSIRHVMRTSHRLQKSSHSDTQGFCAKFLLPNP
jgi:hypothetical protein